MAYNEILNYLQRLNRRRHMPDLHSFKAKVKDGIVYGEARWEDVSLVFFLYDAAGNETRVHWSGTITAAARELESRGLDLASVET